MLLCFKPMVKQIFRVVVQSTSKIYYIPVQADYRPKCFETVKFELSLQGICNQDQMKETIPLEEISHFLLRQFVQSQQIFILP